MPNPVRWHPGAFYISPIGVLMLHPMGAEWPVLFVQLTESQHAELAEACEKAKADPAMAEAMSNICTDMVRPPMKPETKAVANG